MALSWLIKGISNENVILGVFSTLLGVFLGRFQNLRFLGI
jgi:hypothetical protein